MMKTQQQKATEQINSGNELYRQKKFTEAINAYQRAIDLVPAYNSLHNTIGDILFEQGKYQEALAAYQKTADHVPEHDRAWGNIGQCLLFLGSHQDAEAALEKAIEYHPKDALALYYGAVASQLLNNPKKAAKYLQLALEKRPDWETQAQADPTLQILFTDGLMKKNNWWLFWKK